MMPRLIIILACGFTIMPAMADQTYFMSAVLNKANEPIASPYPACQKKYQKEFSHHDFFSSTCAQKLPEMSVVGLVKTAKEIQAWTEYSEFSKLVALRLQGILEKQSSALDAQISCMNEIKTWQKINVASKDCYDFLEEFRHEVLPKVNLIRLHQAIAFGLEIFPTVHLKSDKEYIPISYDWNSVVEKKNRLSAKEELIAMKNVEKNIGEFREDFIARLKIERDESTNELLRNEKVRRLAALENDDKKKLQGDRKWKSSLRQKIKEIKDTHELEFVKLINEYPFLTLVQENNPSPQDIINVLRIVRRNNFKEHVKLNGLLRELEKKGANATSAMEELSEYYEAVHDVLYENQKFCGVATAMFLRGENKGVALMALGILSLPAFIILPSLPSAALGLGISAAYIASEQQDLLSAKQSARTYTSENAAASIDDAYKAVLDRNFSIVTAPLSLVGMRGFSKFKKMNGRYRP